MLAVFWFYEYAREIYLHYIIKPVPRYTQQIKFKLIGLTQVLSSGTLFRYRSQFMVKSTDDMNLQDHI